jgi:hypothetical protein
MQTATSTSPNAGIPAALRKRAQDALTADDMAPEDWKGLIDGLLKFFAEEKEEPEHRGATDSALTLALDRDSVREYDRDGRLRVAKTHVSKANVCPYRGSEIPGYEQLGLDPDKIYNLLRHPDELKKAAPTLNGVPLLRKHVPVNADDHQPDEVVGSLGTDADFDGEYLDNSIFVNSREAIQGIESGRKRELSAGYHYKPDMTPGNFGGNDYDGVMRDIVFNHVALVEDGRVGPDVIVGDSMENIMAKSTKLGALTLLTVANSVAPLLAMDASVVLPKDLFSKLTTKNFKVSREALLGGVRSALDGKLRKGMALDATMSGLAKAIDAFEELEKGVDESVSEPQHNAMEAAAHGHSTLGIPKDVGEEFAEADKGKTFDAEPLKAFLREKGMGEDDIAKVGEMLPKTHALDSEESEEEKKAREKKESEDKAAKDAEMKNMVTQPAMDAALKAQADKFAKDIQAVRESERGVRAAIAEVHPWTGDIPASMAFDSAADVYRHALVMRGVDDAKKLHSDALLPILKSLPKPGARPVEREASIAMDGDVVSKALKLTPDLANISTTL